MPKQGRVKVLGLLIYIASWRGIMPIPAPHNQAKIKGPDARPTLFVQEGIDLIKELLPGGFILQQDVVFAFQRH